MAAEERTPNKQRKHYALRLFVAGNAPNSRIARENLERFRARFPEDEFSIEIVDLNVNPELALEYGVFITPTLQVLEPASNGMIYGNLNNDRILERVLGVAS